MTEAVPPPGVERRQRGRRSTDHVSIAAASELPRDAASTSPRGGESLYGVLDEPLGAAPPPAAGEGSAGAFGRVYHLLLAARAVLGLTLLGAQAMAAWLGARSLTPLLLISAAYAVQACALWLIGRRRPPAATAVGLSRMQWLATIGVDVVVFSALHLLGTASPFNHTPLLVLPVLTAGVLAPRLLALGTAALVTLLLLVSAWQRPQQTDSELALALAQAGLAGIGLFLISLLAGELASRLAREEASARGSREVARQQAQLNRVVIEQMADGVLVVDRRGRVRAANPAARLLLASEGSAPAAPFALPGMPQWERLAQAVSRAFERGSWPAGDGELALLFADGRTRLLRVHGRFTGRRAQDRIGSAAAEELCVLFLEDQRTVQARTQQEKLAAMGRVSAGIAHEIRNPLAAIAQANALLQEDAQQPTQQRLMTIVADNVERLKRIVDDVLEVAPGAPPRLVEIDAVATIGAIAQDWARTTGQRLGERVLLQLPPSQPALRVLFDPDHLRRVLVNLLDNASRHASTQPGAVELSLARSDGRHALLMVASDGEPIAPDVERHLFEPFFSTRSRGSGLGLYICRELCERYGGSIDYRLRGEGAAARNLFVVAMQLAPAAASPLSSHAGPTASAASPAAT